MSKRTSVMMLVGGLLLLYVLLAGRLCRPAREQLRSAAPAIIVADSAAHPFVQAAEIRQLLLVNGLSVEGRLVDSIDLARIEQVVESHPLVRQAEVVAAPDGQVSIYIRQRVPVLRVMGPKTFFLEEDGRPISGRLSRQGVAAVDVPVVTGPLQPTDTLQLKALSRLARVLAKDDFWDAMVEQVAVDSRGQWTLYPRVGRFDIRLGRPDSLEYKLAAVRTFYEEALPRVGWNAYKHISLEYNGQIVCTKRK